MPPASRLMRVRRVQKKTCFYQCPLKSTKFLGAFSSNKRELFQHCLSVYQPVSCLFVGYSTSDRICLFFSVCLLLSLVTLNGPKPLTRLPAGSWSDWGLAAGWSFSLSVSPSVVVSAGPPAMSADCSLNGCVCFRFIYSVPLSLLSFRDLFCGYWS